MLKVMSITHEHKPEELS